MGYYINPPDMTKEQFLINYGVLIKESDLKSASFDFTNGPLPVCLVDNGPFRAAGICYDAGELEAFSAPGDNRPRRWYLVDKVHLQPYL